MAALVLQLDRAPAGPAIAVAEVAPKTYLAGRGLEPSRGGRVEGPRLVMVRVVADRHALDAAPDVDLQLIRVQDRESQGRARRPGGAHAEQPGEAADRAGPTCWPGRSRRGGRARRPATRPGSWPWDSLASRRILQGAFRPAGACKAPFGGSWAAARPARRRPRLESAAANAMALLIGGVERPATIRPAVKEPDTAAISEPMSTLSCSITRTG